MNDLKFYVFCLPRRSEKSYWRAFLWPVKKLAVMLGIMPKTTAGKKWLKRIVFGGVGEDAGGDLSADYAE